jgi:hypothetical protein
LRNEHQPLDFAGFERCKKVLHYIGAGRQVCAIPARPPFKTAEYLESAPSARIKVESSPRKQQECAEARWRRLVSSLDWQERPLQGAKPFERLVHSEQHDSDKNFDRHHIRWIGATKSTVRQVSAII